VVARKAVVPAAAADALAGGLEALEGIIAASGRSVLDAGRALRRIRNERLYQGGGEGTWESFDLYCRLRWDMQRETADKMIKNADVADVLLANDRELPRSAQALTILGPVLRAKGEDGVLIAWDDACEFFGGPKFVGFAALEEMIKAGGKDKSAEVESESAEDPGVVDGTSEVLSEESSGEPVVDDEDWDARIKEAIEEGASEPDSTGEDAGAAVDVEELSGTLERLTRALTVWSDAGRRVRQLAGDAEGLLEELGGVESEPGKALEELISSITEATEETLDSLRDVLEDAEDLPSPVPSGAKPIEEFKEEELDEDGFIVPPTIFSHED